MTIEVPEGASTHGNPRLLCLPSRTWSIVVYFIGNYFTHASTVIAYPGEPVFMTIVSTFGALLLPASGVVKGVAAILRAPWLQQSPIQRAVRAGAVCQVIRTETWRPRSGDTIKGMQLKQNASSVPQADHTQQQKRICARVWAPMIPVAAPHELAPRNRLNNLLVYEVYGSCSLPDGYSLAVVPMETTVKPYAPIQGPHAPVLMQSERIEDTNGTTLSHANTRHGIQSQLISSRPIAQSIGAIIQLICGSITLYKTRGDQVDRYGYAAFGFTVTPYLIMSLLNLIALTVTPYYSYLYLASSDIMDEAFGRGGKFECTIGRIEDIQDGTSSTEEIFSGNFEVNGEFVLCHRPSTESSEDTVSSLGQVVLQVEFSKGRKNEIVEYADELIIPTRPRTSQHPASLTVISCFFARLGAILISSLALVIIGALSGFKPGQSSAMQRSWTMAWIVSGIVFGYEYNGVTLMLCKSTISRKVFDWVASALFVVITGISAVGGFIVTVNMVVEYGTCSLLY